MNHHQFRSAIVLVALMLCTISPALSYELTDLPDVGNVGYFSLNGKTYADIDIFFDMTYSEAVNYAHSLGLIVGTQTDADALAQIFGSIPSWDAGNSVFSIIGGPSSMKAETFDDYWFEEETVKIRYDSPEDTAYLGAYLYGYVFSDTDIPFFVAGISYPAEMPKDDPAIGLGTGLLAYRGEGETTTPEPSAILLLGAGIIGIVCFRKKYGSIRFGR